MRKAQQNGRLPGDGVVDKSLRPILKGRDLTDETPTLLAATGSQRDLDGRVEALAQRLVDLINEAGPQFRPGLRQYAIDLLRDGTEVEVGEGAGRPAPGTRPDTNPLGMGVLLGLFALPMMLIFLPVGLTLMAIALVLSVWGVVAMAVRR